MPASVTQKPAGGVAKPPAPGRSYFFGEFEHHVSTAALSTDGGSQASDGSSTDVGVCLDDSASDISQDSLVTSDSAPRADPPDSGELALRRRDAPPPSDAGFHFHLNEMDGGEPAGDEEEDSFAGLRDFFVPPDATIRSGRGTVRGVKNRVRAGIATFLQENTLAKSFKERERGRLVVYITTMGIVRSTYQKCLRVRQILRTQMVQFEERDPSS
ncbi:glutaredoxin domain-containing cysteine-rich protein CG31559-like [Pollicipes pollicipes]|uniref:glutaredoxin domain-containing cysteine-rich protein CG31559-like n=1 Tax=Pollicipes pollicipes TaxID=41117 RepID=UPI00188510E0|nr:glutaredoxin domain-containing cysteine-rich protein CG31559-like [Pollicipes pollicipes]